jgi:pimeloyl-ACP methyl ester carboxylesterase/DNA-binding winged helix-turn-helix (wHTH) protein/class 3 adenylate cyclase
MQVFASEPRLAFDQFQLDLESGDLDGPSGRVSLTPKALAVLQYLASRPGRLISKTELLETLWPNVFVTDSSIKVCIQEIRRALDDDAKAPRIIETAHRRGYRFIAPITKREAAPEAAPEAPPPELEAHVPVHYARSGDVNIAYQVLGSGPTDLVFVMGWVTHLEYAWRDPSFARFLRRLAKTSRLILFDKRGTGLSDPVKEMPSLEQRMDDVRAVMDAVGSHRAVLLGVSEGGPMCSLFAATYPERTQALVMIGTYARRTRTDDYPWGPTAEQRESFCREILEQWGGPVGIDERAPSRAGDSAFRDWWSSYLRMGASPAAAVALTRMNAAIDIRHILPTVRVPTLVVHRTGDRCLRVEEGRYVASLIPDSVLAELPGEDHLPFVGDQDAVLNEIEQFVSRAQTPLESSRRLATVMCVTLSGAAGELGMAQLQAVVAAETARYGSRWIVHADRTYTTFDGPVRAIRCACALAACAGSFGLSVKIGLHTGECDLRTCGAHDLVGDISARVASLAAPGEVLVARTVMDLVAGSGLRFRDRGAYQLADRLSKWHVFAVEEGGAAPPRDQDAGSTVISIHSHRSRRSPRLDSQVLIA